ncbi:Hypothetical protein CpMEX30_0709 [Corynebacterium pseudotuberculosis]|uniref:SAF domain-containing protein n=1 Tax=Corynebacterium pseudotuberculosis TaxID=1719 RepID=UPI0002504456|nr:SAF domain-containing protein [Corynebacterium pseudotuberculosis]AFB72002.1 hypothetical protein CP316_03470 [Corynebacterium pseudotuberculosis 316]APQ53786.1 Hypothetical protein CpMEX30_0709 [Corynebacterium pseudotuberculosis]APQ55864.1 Hypothetical protein CpMEX31_0714 [Corynebacterium pseudotuberculosis]ASC75021.1 hypothetical protein BFG01_003465 [Corynebacterium pseudotuberculosis]AUY60103.1 Hypothetical protein BFG00_0715 [Corynebacterium pseudotuberculosis]
MTSFLAILRTPSFRRSILLRRLFACLLCVLAAVITMRQHHEPHTTVFQYRRDIHLGEVITEKDLQAISIPTHLLPNHAITQEEDIRFSYQRDNASPHAAPSPSQKIFPLGADKTTRRIAISARPRGSIAVKTDFLPPPQDITSMIKNTSMDRGEELNLVPVRLAQPNLSQLLHPGDRVDLVASEPTPDSSSVVAAGGLVIFVPDPSSNKQTNIDYSALIAFPKPEDQLVAAATLIKPMSVIITGTRTQNR